MKRRFLGMLGAALMAGMFSAAAHAQSPAPAATAGLGKNNNLSMCMGCHGIANYHTAFPEVYHVPKIAGQSPQYIIKALQAYRSGERSHPSMRGIAKNLSDQEMAELAAYYSGSAK